MVHIIRTLILVFLIASAAPAGATAPLKKPVELIQNCLAALDPGAKYKTAGMALHYRLLDFVTPYIPAAALQNYEISFDRDMGYWVYSVSKDRVPAGDYIFVMNKMGQIYVAPFYEEGLHHSSFFKGGRVAAAGALHMTLEGGITRISNRSGHYYAGFKDDCQNWQQMLTELVARGVEISPITIIQYTDAIIGYGLKQIKIENEDELKNYICEDNSIQAQELNNE